MVMLLTRFPPSCVEISEAQVGILDSAVSAATENDNLMMAGVANLIAGRFYESLSYPEAAKAYYDEAYHKFLEWGSRPCATLAAEAYQRLQPLPNVHLPQAEVAADGLAQLNQLYGGGNDTDILERLHRILLPKFQLLHGLSLHFISGEFRALQRFTSDASDVIRDEQSESLLRSLDVSLDLCESVRQQHVGIRANRPQPSVYVPLLLDGKVRYILVFVFGLNTMSNLLVLPTFNAFIAGPNRR